MDKPKDNADILHAYQQKFDEEEDGMGRQEMGQNYERDIYQNLEGDQQENARPVSKPQTGPSLSKAPKFEPVNKRRRPGAK